MAEVESQVNCQFNPAGAVYNTIHDLATTENYVNDNAYLPVGQLYPVGVGDYQVFRSLIQFDLTGLGGMVTAAKLSLFGKYGASVTFDIVVVHFEESVSPFDGDDYGYLLGDVTSLGSMVSDDYVDEDWNDITLNAAALAIINAALGGTLVLGLRSSKDISATPPGAGADEMIQFEGKRFTGNYPKLILTITLLVPTVTTDSASAIAIDQGDINGTLDDDGGEACDCGFEWGETIAYGNTTPTQERTTGQTFSQTISGLDPGKTYHFRAFATNGAGTSYGADRTFTTLVALPAVTTDPVSARGIIALTLNGTLDDDGGESCDCGFEWGKEVPYTNTTPTESKATGETFSQILAPLEPATSYHLRAFARNSAGTTYGADVEVRTYPAPSIGHSLSREEM